MYSPVKGKMIERYCCLFYGSETWDFSNTNFNSVLNSWNISIQKAWNLPCMTYRYLLPLLAGYTHRTWPFLSFYQCIKACLAVQMNMCNLSVQWPKWMLEA